MLCSVACEACVSRESVGSCRGEREGRARIAEWGVELMVDCGGGGMMERCVCACVLKGMMLGGSAALREL